MNLKSTLFSTALICGLVYFSGCDSDDGNDPIVINDQIAHYTFENNADDQAGSNDGEYANVTFQSANGSQVAQFSGSGAVLFSDPFDYPERTVSLWFKALAITDVLGVIYTCDNNSIDYGMTIFSVQNDSNGDPRLSYNACGETFDTEVSEGEWYHVVTTVEGSTYTFYLNGEKVNSGEFDSYTHSGNGQTGALLGTSRAFDRYFTGQVDNMRVYDRALSEKEVEALYSEEENN